MFSTLIRGLVGDVCKIFVYLFYSKVTFLYVRVWLSITTTSQYVLLVIIVHYKCITTLKYVKFVLKISIQKHELIKLCEGQLHSTVTLNLLHSNNKILLSVYLLILIVLYIFYYRTVSEFNFISRKIIPREKSQKNKIHLVKFLQQNWSRNPYFLAKWGSYDAKRC